MSEKRPDSENDHATRVLLVGLRPEAVDFSDPALPPGFNAEKIHAGIAIAMTNMEERGWQADTCLIAPNEMVGPVLKRQLEKARYDCVVIGAGIRLPPKLLSLLETVINVVRSAAPNAAIAFNTQPEDTAEAAARSLLTK